MLDASLWVLLLCREHQLPLPSSPADFVCVTPTASTPLPVSVMSCFGQLNSLKTQLSISKAWSPFSGPAVLLTAYSYLHYLATTDADLFLLVSLGGTIDVYVSHRRLNLFEKGKTVCVNHELHITEAVWDRADGRVLICLIRNCLFMGYDPQPKGIRFEKETAWILAILRIQATIPIPRPAST